jgi:hypothetical protein
MQKQLKPSESYINESRAKVLVEKWSPVLDYTSKNVGEIEDDNTRLNTAILLENQEKYCLTEAGNVHGGVGGVFGAYDGSTNMNAGAYGGTPNATSSSTNNDFYAKGDARLPKILIPMIRRTFPELITNDIVGVQPMSGPVGLAFALRYKYEADSLGADGLDGKAFTSTNRATAGGADGKEIGYQDLDTRFTGASSSAFASATDESGKATFDMIDADKGIAELLANYELTGKIPQVVVQFEKTAVEAGTRRLAARWSVELEQDLKNMNGIDVDTELTNAMSYELQAEIDREMIIRMIQVCLNNTAKFKGVSVWSPASADGRWLAERNRDFYQKLIVEANRIAIRNRRGAANFIVCTPRVAAIMEMLPEFQWMPVNGNVSTQPVGIAKVGNLGGRFNVYRDTRTEAQWENGDRASRVEYALLGYKGPEFYDTGIIYCPYIPVMVQRTIGPNDFSPRVGLLTRYGVVDNIFGAELYYHMVLVNGLGPGTFDSGPQSVVYM